MNKKTWRVAYASVVGENSNNGGKFKILTSKYLLFGFLLSPVGQCDTDHGHKIYRGLSPSTFGGIIP